MTLAVDIMYINEIPFVMTMSWAIHNVMGNTLWNSRANKKQKNINNNHCPKASN